MAPECPRSDTLGPGGWTLRAGWIFSPEPPPFSARAPGREAGGLLPPAPSAPSDRQVVNLMLTGVPTTKRYGVTADSPHTTLVFYRLIESWRAGAHEGSFPSFDSNPPPLQPKPRKPLKAPPSPEGLPKQMIQTKLHECCSSLVASVEAGKMEDMHGIPSTTISNLIHVHPGMH